MKKTIEGFKKRRNFSKKHIDKKLSNRLRIFFLVITILLGIVTYDVIIGKISILLALLGLCLGILLGWIAGRMFKIFWHTETKKVVSRIDKIGAIFLILYMAIEIGKKRIFGYRLHGDVLQVFGLVFLG